MQNASKIETLLEEVIRRKASDLHLQVGLPPTLRVDGALAPIANTPALDEAAMEQLVYALLDDDQKKLLLRDKEFDFSFSFGNLGRFRVNALSLTKICRSKNLAFRRLLINLPITRAAWCW
jgi:twitching motility protein PilT